MQDRIKHIHFIGVAGSGMSGIAQVLNNQGYCISGSDMQDSALLQKLAKQGITTFIGHQAEQVNQADVVVVSSAIADDNAEVQEARKRNIPVVPRAIMLAELMRFKHGIAVAGTHGKTTTTSLVSSILASADLDPTFVIGGKLNSIGDNAHLGTGKYLVAEADESDASFLHLMPIISVVTNIDADHMQTYDNNFGKLTQTFIDFLQKLPFYGAAILCADDENISSIEPLVKCPIISYGIENSADIMAKDIKAVGSQMHFTLFRANKKDLPIVLNIPGKHNVLNALAAIAVATLLEVSDKAIQQALASFAGVDRRFQRYPDVACAQGGSAIVIDDYGHHPVEIQATVEAAREAFPQQRIVLAFQPHRYSRTRDCFEDFVRVIGLADLVYLTEVYAAGEEAIVAADARSLTRAIRIAGKVEPIFIDDLDDMAKHITKQLTDGDVLLCMGAGSIGKLAQKVVDYAGINNG